MDCYRFLLGKLDLLRFASEGGVQIQIAHLAPSSEQDPSKPDETDTQQVSIHLIGVALVPRKVISDADRRLGARYHSLEELCEIQFRSQFPFDDWPGRGLYSRNRDKGYVYFGEKPQSAAMHEVHHRMMWVITGKTPLEVVTK